MEQPKDYLLRGERRAVKRTRLSFVRTVIKRASTRWWIVVTLTLLAALSLVGCGSEDENDPIVYAEGSALRNAQSWCFSRGGVDYFTLEENDPELLVCKDGTTNDVSWDK